MPFPRADDLPMTTVLEGLRARRVVDQARGSGAVTLGELEIDCGARLPLHRHKVEEVIIVLEGTGTFTLRGEDREIGPGAVLSRRRW